jgi:perosamine synthetase
VRVPQCAPVFDAESHAAVDAVLASGWLTEGPQCEAFTAELLAYMQAPYGCLVSNGTVALMLALWAMNCDEARTVAVPDTTFAATANAVCGVGASPSLVDDTAHNIGFAEQGIPVWLFGNAPRWTARLARAVIEDAAQAIGCWVDGKHAGLFGDVGCFSFYADKTLTTGEGGFVVTKDRAIWERLEQLRNHGRSKGARGYGHEAFGINARMTDMQAAIGRVQLRHLDDWIVTKLQRWHQYAHALEGIDGLTWWPVDDGCVPFRFVLMVPDPVALAAFLEEREIQTRRMFLPLHRQPFLSRYAHGDYPQADYAYAHGLLLPCHQYLSESQVAYTCEAVRAFYGR